MSTHPDAIDAESTALVVRGEYVEEARPQENLALFGTSDPVDVITRATRVADALKAMIVKKNLVANIKGKEYPQVEAWQTLAVMLGLAAVCEWSRPVENGWEARVVVQRNGQTIAAAEAQCLKTENSKRAWEDYAIRSMAQTRATSKSLRSVLGFVMVLAGYEATPAEEMPGDKTPAAAAPAKAPRAAAAPASESAEQIESRRQKGIRDIAIFASNRGITDDRRHAIIAAFFNGAQSMKDLSLGDLQKLSKHLQAYVRSGMAEQPEVEFEAWLTYCVDQLAEVEAANG